MENASKALIIAGAILLAIAIIGVGMYVFQQVSGTIQDKANISAEEIETYNQPYYAYEGKNVKGSNVKTLCSKINSHNLRAEDPSELIILSYDTDYTDNPEVAAPIKEGADGTSATDINKIKSGILSGKTYIVSIATDPNTGLVSAVGIKQNN